MSSTSPIAFECIPVEQLAERLIADISNSIDRVHLQAMDFDNQGPMKEVLDAMSKLQRRGVERSIAFDWRMYALTPFATKAIVKGLKRKSIDIVRLGHPWFGTPIARRSHVKLHILDDIVYIGGVNLAGESFSNRDMMLRVKSFKLATLARTIQSSTYNRIPSNDTRYEIDTDNTLLLDGGKNGVSLIIDESIHAVKNARKVWYLSQFAPDSKLVRAMKHIKIRMVKFNTPNSQASLIGKTISLIDNNLGRIRNDYKHRQKIHAKILVTQNDDGDYTVITGSHNFAASGVLFGTREIALLSFDQSLARELISFVESS